MHVSVRFTYTRCVNAHTSLVSAPPSRGRDQPSRSREQTADFVTFWAAAGRTTQNTPPPKKPAPRPEVRLANSDPRFPKETAPPPRGFFCIYIVGGQRGGAQDHRPPSQGGRYASPLPFTNPKNAASAERSRGRPEACQYPRHSASRA